MKDLFLDGYWVNKKSGTIHLVFESEAICGGKKLWSETTNLRYNRDYSFYEKKSMVNHGYSSIDNFLKNYEFICEKPTNEFWVNVLANKKLKDEFTWGLKTNGRLGISKDEFFNKVKGEA